MRAPHLRRRAADAWQVVGLLALVSQLVIGTILVTVCAQPQTTEQAVAQALRDQHVVDSLDTLSVRVGAIEAMHIAERLAVLDANYAKTSKIELLVYGCIVTLVGNLLMTVVQVRDQAKHRRQS